MANKSITKLKNTIKNLSNLYNVVMGAALSIAVTNIVDLDSSSLDINLKTICLFISFLLILVPFYHGALAFLDDEYIERERAEMNSSSVIFDFVFFLLHALVFVVLALLIKTPNEFLTVLICILTIDVIWGVFASRNSESEPNPSIPARWAIINFLFVAISLVFLLYEPYFNPADDQYSIFILIACTARTIVDYLWAHQAYFPSN